MPPRILLQIRVNLTVYRSVRTPLSSNPVLRFFQKHLPLLFRGWDYSSKNQEFVAWAKIEAPVAEVGTIVANATWLDVSNKSYKVKEWRYSASDNTYVAECRLDKSVKAQEEEGPLSQVLNAWKTKFLQRGFSLEYPKDQNQPYRTLASA